MEITVIQFRGHSLLVHQSMSVPWEFFSSSHFISQFPPTRFPLITAFRMCHLLPVHHLGMAFLARSKGQNITIYVSSNSAITFHIQPILEEWRPTCRKSRREQVIISQLRIGHTRLTHPFILKQEQQPQCLTCQVPNTFKNILIECRAFALIRKRFFKVNSLRDLFENIKMEDVLYFLRETGLCQRILWIEII